MTRNDLNVAAFPHDEDCQPKDRDTGNADCCPECVTCCACDPCHVHAGRAVPRGARRRRS